MYYRSYLLRGSQWLIVNQSLGKFVNYRKRTCHFLPKVWCQWCAKVSTFLMIQVLQNFSVQDSWDSLQKSWHHLVCSPSLQKCSQRRAVPAAAVCTCYCEASGKFLFPWGSCIQGLYVYILQLEQVLHRTPSSHQYFSDSALPSLRVISCLHLWL